jgi:hypothetical protein
MTRRGDRPSSPGEADITIRRGKLPNLELENVRLRGGTKAALHMSDGSGAPSPDVGGPVDIMVTGHVDAIELDADSHGPIMMAGGSVGSFKGSMRHRPTRAASRTCRCGFEAYLFTQTCPKCGNALRDDSPRES